MLPTSPDRIPRARDERVLVARIITAVGLALLLVVGAWSTSHGTADLHATLCLAAGVSDPTSTASGTGSATDTPAVDAVSSDAALCLIAALCVVALVLLFRRLVDRRRGLHLTHAPRTTAPPRAGPRILVPALTLAQLSISRT
ncbi:hypothetical protein AB0E56_07430 [Microbacterium sp. NPDC028030]|uniref:hypothetical protein n=1 Tax=Microbacterium sp. NPDC028030 TaxID=3155124 RepID=UPI0033F17074